MSSKPTSFDIPESVAVVWEALGDWRDSCIPEGTPEHDSRWESVCLAMAWIQESLGVPEAVDSFPSPRPLFSLTWERVTQESAEHGDAAARGYLDGFGSRILLSHYLEPENREPERFTIRDALDVLETARNGTSGDLEAVEGNDSDPSGVRWLTWYYTTEYETGDSFAFSLHFPDSLSPASRRRLSNLLTGAAPGSTHWKG